MIVDCFENDKRYYCLNEKFRVAFEYIKQHDVSQLPPGKYNILDDEVYLSVDEYLTKEKSKPEYHKKYIDIQFLTGGEEKIGYCPVDDIDIDEEFNADKDIGFGVGEVDYVKMYPGKFMILYPSDAHQPCMAIDKPQKVKKVVIKVKIEQ